MSITKTNKKLFPLARLFFSLNLASVLTLVVLESIHPLSRIGQLLLRPQNTLSFLHLHPDSPQGARITFLVFVVVLSACIWTLLNLSTARRWDDALVRGASGILAILGPLIGWLILAPQDKIVQLLMVMETTAWIFYAWYCLKTRRSPRMWETTLLLLVCFGLWLVLYRSYVDPVMLTVPLSGSVSYLAWACWMRSPRLRSEEIRG